MSDKTPQKKQNSKLSSSDELPVQEYRLIPADESDYSESEYDIDFIELIKTIWGNRTTIYRFVAIGFVIGTLVVLLTPKEYVSSATLIPEYSTESQGGASSLLKQYGGLLGIGGGGSYSASSNAIRVDLYPLIVQSLTFQQKLAEQEFYFPEEDTTASLFEYYNSIKSYGFFRTISKYTIGLLSKAIAALSSEEGEKFEISQSNGSEIILLTKEEAEVIKDLRSRVNASLNEESGIITVSAKMGNPKLAAEVAKYAIDELTAYLIEYRTEKVTLDLDFIEEQLAKSKERFQEAQLALAEFRDGNQGNLTARAQTEEQRLNSEYDLAFNLYNSFTQQFEEARLKVQEQTPVFKVLQPVQVPIKDETSGIVVLIVFIILSIVVSVFWVFIKHYLIPNNLGLKKDFNI